MPIALWHQQLFLFVVANVGQLVEISAGTKEKLNLQKAWLKVRCIGGQPFPSEIAVQFLNSTFSIFLETFSPGDVPFRSV